MNRLTCSPRCPTRSEVIEYSEVSELYWDTEFALYAFLAELESGTFAIWAEFKSTRTAITQPCVFSSRSVALAHYRELVHDLLSYAHPAARS